MSDKGGAPVGSVTEQVQREKDNIKKRLQQLNEFPGGGEFEVVERLSRRPHCTAQRSAPTSETTRIYLSPQLMRDLGWKSGMQVAIAVNKQRTMVAVKRGAGIPIRGRDDYGDGTLLHATAFQKVRFRPGPLEHMAHEGILYIWQDAENVATE